ncbi:hypothetical protein D3C73_1349510 [compost metagenome]
MDVEKRALHHRCMAARKYLLTIERGICSEVDQPEARHHLRQQQKIDVQDITQRWHLFITGAGCRQPTCAATDVENIESLGLVQLRPAFDGIGERRRHHALQFLLHDQRSAVSKRK